MKKKKLRAITKAMIYLEVLHLNVHKLNKNGIKYLKLRKSIFALLWLIGGLSFWVIYFKYLTYLLYGFICDDYDSEVRLINMLDIIKRSVVNERKAKLALPFLSYMTQTLNLEDKIKVRLK